MTAKNYLGEYKTLSASIVLAYEQRSQIRALAEKITASTEGLPRGTDISDKVGKNAAKIADLDREIQDKINELLALRGEIQATIEQVSGKQIRQILTAIYINGHRVYEAAEIVGYSYSQTERYHLEGLEQIEKIMITNENA